MEADRSTTRTYTANTCELIVSGQELKLARDLPPDAIDPVDFCLHLERSEGSDLDRLTLSGQPQQLNQLQQVVSSYIADLIAKFPIPVAITDTAAREPEVSSGIERDKTDGKSESLPPVTKSPEPSEAQAEVHVDRVEPSSRSGILKNLPGLRSSLPADGHSDERFDNRSGVSKMFGLQPTHRPVERHPAANFGAIDPAVTPATPPVTPDRHTPYLTGSGDRSLDHYLHLGDLATATSGEVVSLSALQLFDLAIVLDAYANANLSPADRQKSATINRTLFQSDPANTNTAPVDPVRLSDFARGAADPVQYPVYYRNRRSRSSFMSGIPWAIAAALAVGVPLAMLDPNSNPLKDAANKIKMPDLAATKKSASVPSTAPGAIKTDLSKSNPTAALPTPWQAQPVQPPASTKPTATPSTGSLGSAPLPEALGGAGQNPATITGQPASATKSTTNQTAANPIGTTTPQSNTKPGSKTTPVVPSPKSGSTPKSVPTQIGQLPIDTSTAGKISISTQPALLPPTDPSPSVTTTPVKPVPFPKSGLDEAGRIDPFDRPTTPTQTDRPNKPAVATKPKPKPNKPQPSALNPSPNEPFTPVPKNPNLISPTDRSSTEGTDPQVQPVVPDRPLQSNNAADPAENNPTLQEAKRYFQGKWKASTTQPNALQYVLQVSKNGTVRSISPQGEAATTYLQQTKLIKTGQKLLSPAAGSSDQKIRVLLQPDGGVDTFTEP
jgi:Domain of unknown function (DUF4335)